MNDKVKQIMRLSFHKDFYVDNKDMKSNYEYLDALVDLALEEITDKSDYDAIANKIWQYDIRIKNIFNMNFEIMTSIFCEIEGIDETICECCSKNLPFEDIKRLVRCSKNEDVFVHNYRIATILYNWNSLLISQKTAVMNTLVQYIKKYEVDLNNDLRRPQVYIVADTTKTIAINELIFLISREQRVKTSHQSVAAITLLRDFEKTQMYFQFNELLTSRVYEGFDNQYDGILSKIIRPMSPMYNDADNEFLFEDCSLCEKYWANAYVYIQDLLCRLIFNSQNEKKQLLNMLKTIEIESQKKQHFKIPRLFLTKESLGIIIIILDCMPLYCTLRKTRVLRIVINGAKTLLSLKCYS